jgi:hypothetical protein
VQVSVSKSHEISGKKTLHKEEFDIRSLISASKCSLYKKLLDNCHLETKKEMVKNIIYSSCT